MNSLAERVRGVVHGFLQTIDPTLALTTIRADTALVSTGLLDSMALVQLAAMLEREFTIAIPDRDIAVEHFETLEAIQDYVAQALGSPAAR